MMRKASSKCNLYWYVLNKAAVTIFSFSFALMASKLDLFVANLTANSS